MVCQTDKIKSEREIVPKKVNKANMVCQTDKIKKKNNNLDALGIKEENKHYLDGETLEDKDEKIIDLIKIIQKVKYEQMDLVNYKNEHLMRCKDRKRNRSDRGSVDSKDYHDPVNEDFLSGLGFNKNGNKDKKESKFSKGAKRFFGF